MQHLLAIIGILTRASETKEKTQIASVDELRTLTMLEATTNLENQLYTDKNGDTTTIPAGFAVSQVAGENTIEDGLVIIDKNGNEFVWIPVKNFDEFEREDFGTEAQKWWSGIIVTNEPSTSNMYEPKADGIAEDTEVEKMYKSVKENNGFYVGRYEAGTNSSDSRTKTSGIDDSVVVKQGATVYNYIGWSNNDDMSVEIGGAVQKSREFAEKNEYSTVTSTLIYGVQWDAIIRWMKDEPNLTSGRYVQDSSNMGWYSHNYTSGNPSHETGIDLDGGKNKVKNIYDLAGNVFEWTMEIFGRSNRVCRGGGYFGSGSEFPISYRSGNYPSDSLADLGFRITLYIN